MSDTFAPELLFKAKVVHLVLSKDTEKAVELASRHYGVAEPRLVVGLPKRHSKNLACYVAEKRTIHISCREILYDPHVILHEFYHHLRNSTSTQKGLEKHADKFAMEFLEAYKIVAACCDLTAEIEK